MELKCHRSTSPVDSQTLGAGISLQARVVCHAGDKVHLRHRLAKKAPFGVLAALGMFGHMYRRKCALAWSPKPIFWAVRTNSSAPAAVTGNT